MSSVRVIQLPPVMRAYAALAVCVFGVVGAVMLVSAVADGQVAVVVFTVVWLVLALTLAYRMLRASVVLDHDELLVRNFLRTRRLPRGEVEGFRSGSYGVMSFSRCVFALLRDGTVMALDVTIRPGLPGRSRPTRDAGLRQLQAWLTGTPTRHDAF